MWQYLLLVILSIFLYNYLQSRKKFSELARTFPHGITSLPFFGVSYLFLGNNEAKLKALQRLGMESVKNGGVGAYWVGPRFFLVVADPEMATPFLKNCLDKDNYMDVIRTILGNGNFVAPVPIWRPRRKILIPTFKTKYLNAFMNIFVKQSEVLVNILKERVGTGPVAMWDYVARYSMDTAGETVLGLNLNTQKNPEHPFINFISEGGRLLGERICQPWLHSDVVYNLLPQSKRLSHLKDQGYNFVDEVIRQKRQELEDIKIQKGQLTTGTTKNNLHKRHSCTKRSVKPFLELLIDLSKEDGKQYTDIQLREEVLTLILRSMDSSAIVTGFILRSLADHPDKQDKVFEELKEVFGDSNRSVTLEDLPRLEYLEAVIKETLRLYPPVPVIMRKVIEDYTLPSGVIIPAGCGVLIHIWAIDRNPKYWGPDAEQFRPERFLGEPLKHPAQFIPFSYGPRGCTGNRYAMMSLKTGISTVLRRYKVLPAGDNKPMKLSFELLLKDLDHYTIQLESR